MNVEEEKYGYLDQPYLAAVLRYYAEHPPTPGKITHVAIRHDDWCPILHGTGHCICRPSVEALTRAERRRFAAMERSARKTRP